MKVNLTNTFDPSQLDDKTLKTIQPFVDYVNNFTATVTQLLRGKLSIGDNIGGQVVSYSMVHNVPLSTNLTSPVSGIIPLSVQGTLLTGVGWQFDSKGFVQLTVMFSAADTTSRGVVFAVLS